MYDIEKITMAATVKEAVTALKADPTAVVISGGSDVLIKIRAGKLAGCRLVCIRNICCSSCQIFLPALQCINYFRTPFLKCTAFQLIKTEQYASGLQ